MFMHSRKEEKQDEIMHWRVQAKSEEVPVTQS